MTTSYRIPMKNVECLVFGTISVLILNQISCRVLSCFGYFYFEITKNSILRIALFNISFGIFSIKKNNKQSNSLERKTFLHDPLISQRLINLQKLSPSFRTTIRVIHKLNLRIFMTR